jgi:MFS family permease
MFGAVRLVPKLAPRIGSTRLLAGGVSVAFVGMVWLSRLSAGTPYFPQIVLPMALLGIGIGSALVPLTTAGIAGVAPDDAGAASGLVNVAQQLGGSLGLGILVTVFAAASHEAPHRSPGSGSSLSTGQLELAHAVAASLTGSAIFLALALGVVLVVMRRPSGVSTPRRRRPRSSVTL